MIVSPLPDSPAEKAGLLPGDRILKIGGAPTDTMGLGDAVKQIKGRPGTTVALLISRDGTDPKEVQVVRSTISVKSADWKMLADNIGYMHIGSFNDTTARLVKTGLAELRSQGMHGLLLDLRDNPGGGLDVCIDVAGNFIGSSPAVYIEERGAKPGARTPMGGATRLGMPLVVLVNNGSAQRFGDRLWSHPGQQGRRTRRRYHLRQGPGADRLPAPGWVGAHSDHRPLPDPQAA